MTEPRTLKIPVKVIPRAARNEIVGWLGGALKVRIAAVPTDGRANDALERFLTEALRLRRGQVRIASGHRSQRKVVELESIDRVELDRRCAAASRR